MFTCTKIFFPSLPNLGAQIRCAQNQYTPVQMDLKYPLSTALVPYLRYTKFCIVDLLTFQYGCKLSPKGTRDHSSSTRAYQGIGNDSFWKTLRTR